MIVTTDERWIACLKDFEDSVSSQSYKTWFSTIRFDDFDNGILKFIIPSHFFYEWLMEHYKSLLKKVFVKNFGLNIKFIEFQTIIPKDWVYKTKDEKPQKVEIISNIHDELIADLRKEPTLVHKFLQLNLKS